MPRSLVDIIPPSKRRTIGDMPIHDYQSPPQSPSPTPRSSGKGGFPYVTALIGLVVITLSIGAIFAFGGAEVEITPYAHTARVDNEFTATAFVGDLPYEVVTVEKIGSQSVPAESTVTASDPAQGTLTIYNKQSSPQTLIKNTRFETGDGLIFRIRDSVTVPKGSEEKPGTLSVTVYADEGGERYNVGPSRFTLPGLKGSATYELVYAESQAPMTGGFSGERPSVGEATKTATSDTIRVTLEKELMDSIRAEVPEGYIFLPTVFTSFEPQPDTSGAQGTVEVRLKGVAQAIMFPQAALAKAVAHQVIPSYNGEPVTFQNVDALVLRPKEEALPTGEEEFTFTLTGEATVVWQIDSAKIAGAVAGKKRDSAEAILSGFTEVGKAVTILRPFWADTFPADPEKIKVTITAL